MLLNDVLMAFSKRVRSVVAGKLLLVSATAFKAATRLNGIGDSITQISINVLKN